MTYSPTNDDRVKSASIVIDWGKRKSHLGDSRQEIPEHWLIFNAPRPLLGSALGGMDCTWQGDFGHGIFYAGVDPESEHSDAFIQANMDSDAYIVVHLANTEARALTVKMYMDAHGNAVVPEIEEALADADDEMIAGEVARKAGDMNHGAFCDTFEAACVCLLDQEAEALYRIGAPASLALAHQRERERITAEHGERRLGEVYPRLDSLAARMARVLVAFKFDGGAAA